MHVTVSAKDNEWSVMVIDNQSRIVLIPAINRRAAENMQRSIKIAISNFSPTQSFAERQE